MPRPGTAARRSLRVSDGMCPPLASKNPRCPNAGGSAIHYRTADGSLGCDLRCAAADPVPSRCAAQGWVRRLSPSPLHVQPVACADAAPRTLPTRIAGGPVPFGRCGCAVADPVVPALASATSRCRRRTRWLPRSASSGRGHRCCDSASWSFLSWPCSGLLASVNRSMTARSTPAPVTNPLYRTSSRCSAGPAPITSIPDPRSTS